MLILNGTVKVQGELSASEVERPFLIAVFFMIYIAYAGLGRDVFFNHLEMVEKNDPLTPFMNPIRSLVTVAGIVVVCANAGFGWAFSKVPYMFLPFILWAVASSIWSDSEGVIRIGAVLLLLFFSLPMVVHRLGIVDTTRYTIVLVAIVMIISALLGLFVPSIGRHTGLEIFQSVHAGRWKGIFIHKNSLGFWAAFGTVFIFSHSWIVGGPRWFWWLARIAAVLCLFFSQSSSSLIVTSFCFAMLGYLYVIRYLDSMNSILLLAFILLIFGLPIYYGKEFIFELVGRDASFSGRSDIWALAITVIQQEPFFGGGYQTGGGSTLQNLILQIFKQPLGPENAYLTILLELGVIGFALYIVPVILAFRNGFKWLPHLVGKERAALEFMLTLCAGTLVQGLVDSNPVIATGFDGVIGFGSLFALMTLPKCPADLARQLSKTAAYFFAGR